jgi:hypothetical protein
MQGMPGQGPPPLDPRLQAQLDAIKRISAAISLIRDERLRGFRIDIEVDSTIFPDAAQEKQDRVEFITATTKFLQESMLMGQQMPELVPLLGKFLQFGVRGYKVGRDLEASIEDFCEQAPQIIQQKLAMAAQQPNPEQLKAQADMAKVHGQMQIAREKQQGHMAKVQADAQSLHMKAQTEQQQAQADMQGKQMDIEIKKIEQQMEVMRMMIEQMKLKMEMQLGQQEMAHDQTKMQYEGQQMAQQSAMDQQHMQHEQQQMVHQSAMDQQHMQHEQTMGQQHMQQDQQRHEQEQQRAMMRPQPQPKPGQSGI